MDKPRHPPLLKVLFFTEMWERFNFYLMVGILYQYLTDSSKGGMEMSGTDASVIMGSYIGLVYFTPFIGGLVADRLLGCRMMIVIGGILMMLGSFALAIPGLLGLYLGLGLLILGNGAFKPNISTMVGNLYPPGSPLRDAGFNIFYMGINIGAFFCNFVAALVRNYVERHPEWGMTGWNAAFATGGIGMLVGMIVFLPAYRALGYADPDPRTRQGTQESLRPLWVNCILPAIFAATLLGTLASKTVMGWISEQVGFTVPRIPLAPATAAFLGACIPVIFFYLSIWRQVQDADERGRVAALLVIFGVVVIFWAIFHLNTTALTEWAKDDTDRRPNAVVRVVTDPIPDFAEVAPPEYYVNAGPDTPRPHPNSLRIVSKEEREQRQKKNQLMEVVKVGGEERVYFYVTEELRKAIYAKADGTTPTLKDGESLKLVNTELFQSINPGLVVMFTPLLVAFWHFLRLRGKEPSTPAKLGLGLLITAGAPLVMLAATVSSDDGALKASSWWLFGTYAIATVGELCLSPMGLSLVSKTSPAQIRAFMMGGWFLSTSFGNKLSGIFGEVYQEMEHVPFWIMLACSAALFGGIIFALLPWLKRQMKSVG